MYRNTAGILLLSSLLFPSAVLCSSGDRAPAFQACVSQCERRRCAPPREAVILPLALRLTQWTCKDDCQYTCMHVITDQAVSTHDDVHQYYGKWPFWRLAGMQEPASVMFSILNFWAHIQGLSAANRAIPKDHPIKIYYMAGGFVNVNSWIWSAVFHTRGITVQLYSETGNGLTGPKDNPVTEKLDYFSAGLAILYSLFCTVVRLFHLYAPSQQRGAVPRSSAQRAIWLKLWGILCLVLYLLHISYLTFLPRFDYTYNMAANVVIGMLHNLLWITYSFPSFPIRPFPLRSRGYRPKHMHNAALLAILISAATALELFDFPPWWRVIDAHALWHLSTIPIVSFWWRFLINDALDEGWMAEKI